MSAQYKSPDQIRHSSSRSSSTFQTIGRLDYIDGLRAIAVIAVVAYHLFFKIDGFNVQAADFQGQTFSGGFLGVDVFFVISGFVITKKLIGEYAKSGSIQIKSFYLGRLQRLHPALVAMVASTLAVAWFTAEPGALKDIANAGSSAVLSSSNIFFAFRDTYWSPDARLNPLLHTWSLGVEEQFYLFYPVVLSIALRRRLKLSYVLIILTTLSFLVYLSVGSSDSQSNFFFSPSRVWELTAGALAYCFFATQQGATRFKIFYAVFPPLGLAIIVTAFLMDQDLNGGTIAWTFLAILGSFLVLAWTQPGGKFAGAISLKPLRTIGKYSYSIYLWHWPVLVYSKLWKIDHLLIPLIVIALLACLSKLVLEDYGRSYLRLRRPSRTVIFYLTSVFVVVTMGLGAVYSNGGIFRYGVSASLWGDLSERRPLEQCPRSLARDLAVSDNCTMLGVAPKPGTGKVLIVGDSHAEALAWGINVQLRSHHASGILVKSYSCAPILGASLNVTPQSFRDCSQALELERHLILAGGFEAIIFAAKWELPFQNLDSGSFVDTNSRRAVSQEKLRGLFRATLLLAKQNANRVVVIQQAPKQGIEPRNLYLSIAHMNLSKHQANALILRRSSSLLNAEKELARSRDTLNKLSRDAGVLVVDPLQIMCTQKCPIGYAARSSYLDSTHVSDWGSLKIAQSIWSEIQDGDG